MSKEELLLAFREGKYSAEEVLKLLHREKKTELSEGQKELWMLQTLYPDMTGFNLPLGYKISEGFQVNVFREACEYMLKQFPILSAGFDEENGVPFCFYRNQNLISFQVEDVPGIGREAVTKLMNAQFKVPFNLKKDPLIRFHIYKTSESESYILVTIHHIIFDGTSTIIFTETLLNAYHDLLKGKTPVIEKQDTHFGDFVRWEQEMLDDSESKEHFDFWKEQFKGELPLVAMPSDHQVSKIRSFSGATIETKITDELLEKLEEFSKKLRVNKAVLFLAAFKSFIYRYSHQEDIILSMPTAGRPERKFEDVLGYFIYMVSLRSRISGDQTFSEFLEEVQYKMADTLDHANYPTTKVLRDMKISGNQAALRLFKISFFYQNFIKGAKTLYDRYQPDFRFEFLNGLHQEGEQEFVFEVFEEEEYLQLNCHYDPESFEKVSIDGIIDNFKSFLNELIQNPDLQLDQYNLLSQQEEIKILKKWNGTTIDLPADQTVLDLIAENVSNTPDAVALIHEGQSMSYQELDEKSNAIAAFLLKNREQGEKFVGIGCGRSSDMIIGLLGTMKAGKAYIPIDVEYPDERVEAIISESNLKTIITGGGNAERFSGFSSKINLVSLTDSDIYKEQLKENINIDQADLAYVLFTSGSTGIPKGVMITHKGLLNLSLSMQKAYQIKSTDRVVQFASLSFDMSVEEIFPYLASGAGIVIRDKDDIESKRFLNLVVENEVTILNLPPAFGFTIDQYSATEKKKFFEMVRLISFGGDQLEAELIDAFRNYNVQIFNAYGPTEYTVNTTLADLTKENAVTIGKPIDNTYTYILDKNLKPVPVLSHGELFISGAGIARGYLNQEELTRERFIDNPFIPGTKMYRTGDSVRWNANGDIEFIGRLDYQVKIRGFRIELNEVETVIHEYDEISGAVVIAKKIGSEKQLVAFFTAKLPGGEVQITELQNFIKERLPDYMVPAKLVQLDLFPLTSNGKIDRKALDDIEVTFERTVDYTSPETESEKIVAEIWSDVLKIEKIGIHDNFFELGGHSLLATQAISRMNKVLGVEIPPSRIFEHPQISTLLKTIEPEREHHTYEPISKLVKDGPLQLSFAQERLWFLAQTGLSDQYHIPLIFNVKGEFNIEIFENAINLIIERHESLRTTFTIVDERPVQLIHGNADLQVNLIDLSNSKDEKDSKKELIQEFVSAPFDLEFGPVIRVIAIRESPMQSTIGINIHHIASDGWSSGLLLKELTDLYELLSKEEKPLLAPLPVQYADFAQWQRNKFSKSELDAQLSYWKNQLEGYLDLDLPTDFIRPKKVSGKGDHIKMMIPKLIVEETKQNCIAHKLSFFSVLMTSVYVLLYKYSGQTDITIGYTSANRNHHDLEKLIGFFVNTLILRVDENDSDKSVSNLLKIVNEKINQAQDHQQLPFEKLVEELQPNRDTGRSPLFQVMVTYFNNHNSGLSFGDSDISISDFEYPIAKFDLSFDFNELPNGNLIVTIEYATDLFRKETVSRMLNHLKIILTELAFTEKTIPEISLLSEVERQKIYYDFNREPVEYPKNVCIHQLFEKYADLTPENTAITDGNRSLTYREVNEQANKIASYLVANDLQKEDLIAICMDRSIEMVVSVFGVLKSGGAYLPIGIENPDDRIKYMVEDSQVKFVFTDPEQESRLDELLDDTVISAVDQEFIQRLPDAVSALPEVTSDNLAYVIYTSGSTGKPKGVMLEHRGVVNYLLEVSKCYRYEKAVPDNMTFAFIGNISFDATATGFFVPMVSGSTCYVIGANLSHEEIVRKVFEEDAIDLFTLTPSHLKLLLELDITPSVTKKLVIIGGEALHKELVESVMAKGIKMETLNAYGPTECSVAATAHYYDKNQQYNHNVPIGKPIANSTIFILDKNQNLLPIGVPGELHIGGGGLARGYLRRPELTAEKFIDHPFEAGEKLYRTGDLVKWLHDGNIEFLGRIDDQVKIRGYRIELGEIENLINEIESIENCAVLVAGEGASKFLVSYYQSENELNQTKLKNLLKGMLPDYMVPATFIHMEELPLTPNGKINRKYLESLPVQITATSEYSEAEDQLQQSLVEIWQEILVVEKIGIDDDFFEVGGHSLLATQIVTRINKKMDAGIRINDLFDNPTIRELSSLFTEDRPQTVSSPKIKSGLRDEKIPLSYSQERLWFMDKMGQSLQFHTPYVCNIDGYVDVEKLNEAFTMLIERHEVLRTSFREENGKSYQYIENNISFKLSYKDLSKLRSQEQRINVAKTTDKWIKEPFELSKGPLIRAILLKTESRRFRLCICMHHIITDGWSVKLMMKELSLFYKAASNEPVILPKPLTIQYADYAVWQKSDEVSEYWEEELEYWKDQLADYKNLMLPTDFLRESQTKKKGEVHFVKFNDAQLKAIRSFTAKNKVTPFALVMTSVYVMLSRYANQKDICIGFPAANRNQQEVESLIGFFLNTLIIRINTEESGNLTALDLLNLVQKQILDSQTHQNIPVDKIIEFLQPDRNSGFNPIFQVMMNYLYSKKDDSLQIGGADLTEIPVDYDASKFDLTFSFGENPESLIMTIDYNQDLFLGETVKRMADQVVLLIDGIISNVDTDVRNISMLTESDKSNILNTWNKTTVELPDEQCIHKLFRNQAIKTPDAVALRKGNEQISYQQLDKQSDQFAAYLQQKGVGNNSLIGLMLDRSFDMIISILGILKAGGAYLPIDIHYPEERIAYILEISSLQLVITDQSNVFDKKSDVEWIKINELKGNLTESRQPQDIVKPEDLAYVIYTSGSTGKPKGVMVEHRNVVNHNLAAITEYELDASDNVMQFSTISFDIFVEEVFPALLCGASVTLLDGDKYTDPQYFKEVIEQQGITMLNLPTAYWNSIATQDFSKTTVRKVVIGGEKAELSTSKIWQEHNADIPVYNTYGPTEATVIALVHKIDDYSDRQIPIGKPIGNVEVYVLDENLHIQPVGVSGELYIAGAGVARGYLNQPKLTTEKFIDNPFRDGEKMYRTGDLVRWLNDGEIEFLGRVDDQVKIRGYRIEPGEVAHAITQIKGISNATVIAKESGQIKQLVAFYVTDTDLTPEEVRSTLKTKLPEYMMPAHIEPIIAIPLTANGKIDKRKLRSVELTANNGKKSIVELSGDLEIRMGAIWSELLNHDHISADDNFFEIGGHSLLAIQLISRIKDEFKIDIMLADLFKIPTIKELSNYIQETEPVIDDITINQYINNGDDLIF